MDSPRENEIAVTEDEAVENIEETAAPPEDEDSAAPPWDAVGENLEENAGPPEDEDNAAPPEDEDNAAPPEDEDNASPPEDENSGSPPEDEANDAPPEDENNAAPTEEDVSAAPPTDEDNAAPAEDEIGENLEEIAASPEEEVDENPEETAAPPEEEVGENPEETAAPTEEEVNENPEDTAAPPEEEVGENPEETAAPPEEEVGENPEETAAPPEEEVAENPEETAAPPEEEVSENPEETAAPPADELGEELSAGDDAAPIIEEVGEIPSLGPAGEEMIGDTENIVDETLIQEDIAEAITMEGPEDEVDEKISFGDSSPIKELVDENTEGEEANLVNIIGNDGDGISRPATASYLRSATSTRSRDFGEIPSYLRSNTAVTNRDMTETPPFLRNANKDPDEMSSFRWGPSRFGGISGDFSEKDSYLDGGMSPLNDMQNSYGRGFMSPITEYVSRKNSFQRGIMSPVSGHMGDENPYLSNRASPAPEMWEKKTPSAKSIRRNMIHGTDSDIEEVPLIDSNSPWNKDDISLNAKDKKSARYRYGNMSEEESSIKSAEDVQQRIQWDRSLQEEYFSVGYMDPFSGVVEKPFTSIDWEHLDTSRIRIHHFKYKGIKVWDIDEGLDHVFGSDGNNVQIQQKIEEIEEDLQNKALAFNPDDYESDEDDFIMLGGASVIGKGLDYCNGGSPKSNVARATHFFCIRVKDEYVKSMVARVQEHIIREDPVLRSCAMLSELLHITLTRVQCRTPESVLEVNNILKAMRPRIQDLVGSSEESNPQRTIKARSLATFGERVLYAKLDVPASFTSVVETMHESLGNIEDVLVTSHFEFVPHMTLLKMNRAAARGRGSKTLDVSLYSEYIDHDFGVISFDNIHFCPIYDIKGPDGFYVTSKKIQF